jgi:hypothetical protein
VLDLTKTEVKILTICHGSTFSAQFNHEVIGIAATISRRAAEIKYMFGNKTVIVAPKDIIKIPKSIPFSVSVNIANLLPNEGNFAYIYLYVNK